MDATVLVKGKSIVPWNFTLKTRFFKISRTKAQVKLWDVQGLLRNYGGLSRNFWDRLQDFWVLKKAFSCDYFFTFESEHKLLITVNFLIFNTVGYCVFKVFIYLGAFNWPYSGIRINRMASRFFFGVKCRTISQQHFVVKQNAANLLCIAITSKFSRT